MTNQSDTWTLVAEISPQFDTSVVCAVLDMQRISYKINRLEHSQELWVEFPEQVPLVLSVLENVNKQESSRQQHQHSQSLTQQLKRMPIVALLLLLSILGTALVEWAFPLIHWFTFQDIELIGNTVHFHTAEDAMDKGQYWRLITPIFLHFGIFHLAFNGVWLWELGRRIEPLAGSVHMGVVALLMAVASNLGQYLWSGPSLFGGMSGVVYGLLGYIWIRHKINPQPILAIPRGLLAFMLFWLLLGMSGFINLFMSGSIANTAHAVGLVTGMVLGGWAGRGAPRST